MEDHNLLRDVFYFFAVIWVLFTLAGVIHFWKDPVVLLFTVVFGAFSIRYWLRRAKRGE